VTVHWLTTATEGALEPESSITDVNGLASAQWTLGRFVGINRVAAMVAGGNEPLVNFTAQAVPDQPEALIKVTGDNQHGPVNAVLRHLQVRVVDRFENGVPGVEVEWSTLGGTLISSRVTTDPSGISSAQVILGDTPGEISITAAVDGLSGSPQIFTATAVLSEPEPANRVSQSDWSTNAW
jgi:hypothetical protein